MSERKKKGKKGLHKNETIIALGFLAPAMILFLLFVLVPIIWVMVLSFLKYDILTPAQFIGLRNWRRLGNDPRLWLTLKNTIQFVGLIVPMHIIIGLVLALGVNYIKNKVGIYIYRTLFYFPTLVTSASVIIAWRYMLSTDTGMINYYLGLLGIPAIPWLSSSFWVYPSTMLFSLWKFHGAIFLYLFIGLQAIDPGFIEAALIDGANAWQRFWHITIPMISPTLFFVIIVNLINCFQIFDEPFLLTKSGPGDASRTISVYIYETAYGSQNYGYASVAALVLLVIIMVVTLIQMKGSNMWVTYDRE